MDRDDVQIGSTITNGSSAIRVTERVVKDLRWETSGWLGMSVPLGEFGGKRGMSSFVADYLLESWYHLPFEWRDIPSGMEERYVWEPGWRWLNREVRTAIGISQTGICVVDNATGWCQTHNQVEA